MELEARHPTMTHLPSRLYSQKSEYLNFLLRDIAEQRDLTPSKHALAEERYGAVANWFDNSPDDEPLSKIKIKIYPIGSFLSCTPVRPLAGDEFDVDMAGELQLNHEEYPDPRAAVDIFEKRLRKNKKYDDIAERKTRVIRLNYSGDFHLDFMPCFPAHLSNNNTSIKIPHKLTPSLYVYKDSNPLGLNVWFEKQCNVRKFIKAALSERVVNEITPFPEPEDNKLPLKLALQIFKHIRNLYFVDDPEGRKDVTSVILQVLMAVPYDGEQNLYYILSNTIQRIFSKFYFETSPSILNPINEREDFAEKWRQDPNRQALKKFKGFIFFCKQMLDNLEHCDAGLVSFAAPLKKLFGEIEVNKALEKLGQLTTSNTKKGLVGVTSAGLFASTKSAATTKITGHKFYGTK